MGVTLIGTRTNIGEGLFLHLQKSRNIRPGAKSGQFSTFVYGLDSDVEARHVLVPTPASLAAQYKHWLENSIIQQFSSHPGHN